ncbi:MAG: hypothetical protein KGR26_16335 [Cyanobacteria bacterium REEB65]|nr:hypothetical protein [Cyanobacteria bacterium REEB65]
MSYQIIRISRPNGPHEPGPPVVEAANIAELSEAIKLQAEWRRDRYCEGRGPEALNGFFVYTMAGQLVFPAQPDEYWRAPLRLPVADPAPDHSVLESFVRDLAGHGLRFDLNPTLDHGTIESTAMGYLQYLRRIDASVRERAATKLEEGGFR